MHVYKDPSPICLGLLGLEFIDPLGLPYTTLITYASAPGIASQRRPLSNQNYADHGRLVGYIYCIVRNCDQLTGFPHDTCSP